MITSQTPSTASPSSATFEAPGRVNLIGEHTDYTGGLVLPMAIQFTTIAEIGPARTSDYTFTAAAFNEIRQVALNDHSGKAGEWSDYPLGVLREFQKLGIKPPPFDLRLSGNVPLGAGLSSSASVEVVTAMALLSWSRRDMSPAEIALLCQRAENIFVGSPCGIMDQFVIAAAHSGHALMLHTRDLTFDLLPMNTGELKSCVVVIVNSGVRHSVADGEYGVRRHELEIGQSVLRERFALRDLGEANLDQLLACKDAMRPESFRRCRHVVSENGRVRKAAAAMRAGDAAALGSAMLSSHYSQRDDFECSVEEIDFLIEAAMQIPGCHGARLTGGGFGGCTVNLVAATMATGFSNAVQTAYRERFGIDPEIYVCKAVDGAVARSTQHAEGLS